MIADSVVCEAVSKSLVMWGVVVLGRGDKHSTIDQ